MGHTCRTHPAWPRCGERRPSGWCGRSRTAPPSGTPPCQAVPRLDGRDSRFDSRAAMGLRVWSINAASVHDGSTSAPTSTAPMGCEAPPICALVFPSVVTGPYPAIPRSRGRTQRRLLGEGTELPSDRRVRGGTAVDYPREYSCPRAVSTGSSNVPQPPGPATNL
jgi:hypothetical protein